MEQKDILNALRMNLQFFADENTDNNPGEGDNNEPDNNNEDNNENNKKDEQLPQSAEELNKLIEAESDRKLNTALDKKQKQWERETERKIQEALEEEKRLSKLSEKERKDAELTQREKQIEQKMQEIERKELESETIADLRDKNLPETFAKFLIQEDAETTLENINDFKKEFEAAVNEASKAQLRQETPGASSFKRGTRGIADVKQIADEARLIK